MYWYAQQQADSKWSAPRSHQDKCKLNTSNKVRTACCTCLSSVQSPWTIADNASMLDFGADFATTGQRASPQPAFESGEVPSAATCATESLSLTQALFHERLTVVGCRHTRPQLRATKLGHRQCPSSLLQRGCAPQRPLLRKIKVTLAEPLILCPDGNLEHGASKTRSTLWLLSLGCICGLESGATCLAILAQPAFSSTSGRSSTRLATKMPNLLPTRRCICKANVMLK